MTEITRFDLDMDGSMEPSEDGQWVRYEDAQRKPLTHAQRFDLLTAFEQHKNKWEAPAILIDMVEAAHNIKE